jgi:8-oxo-dGTP pyrophosphatase MutT (NUDIX family)
VAAHRLSDVPEPPVQRIADLRREPGELSFEARLGGGEPRRIWLRSETEVTPSADAALAACLMPAMRSGGRLEIDEPISPRLLDNQREYQAIQRAWSFAWKYGEEPLEEVEVEAPPRSQSPSSPSGRVAAFFSGGVDSFATILANPDVTDLIFIRGVDILPRLAHQDGLAGRVETRLREAAEELGMPLHVVETNVRDLSDPLIRWECYFSNPLLAVSHFFAPLFDRVLITGDTDHETQPPIGTSLLIDHLWSSEGLEVVDFGGRLNREQRIQLIAEHPVVRRTLRTCWENPDGAYNCGRCRKCMLTMISLEAIGARQGVETFPAELDVGRLAELELNQRISLALCEDLLATVRERGRADMEPAVAAFVEKGRRTLGLAKTYRSRPSRDGVPETMSGVEQEALEAELATVLESRSWRLTKPLRQLGDRLRARRGR